MTNKVSILPLQGSGVVTLDGNVPSNPFVQKLTFVRNLPYTSDLQVKFLLELISPESDFILSGIDSFNGNSGVGVLTIPENSSHKTVYVSSFESLEFFVKILQDPGYTFLLNNPRNSLTTSGSVYSWINPSSLEINPSYQEGTIKVNSLQETISLNPSPSKDLNPNLSSEINPVSVKLNSNQFVVIWINSPENLSLQKVSASTLLPISPIITYSPENLSLDILNFVDLKAILLPQQKILLTFNYSYLQIFNSDLSLSSEAQNLTYEPGCDLPPYSCNTDVDTSCIDVFEDTWGSCEFEEFPVLDTSNGVLFIGTWQGCSNLTSFPLIDTSKGVIFDSTWRFTNFTSFPLLDLSKGVSFTYAWSLSYLTEFPEIDFSNGKDFSYAWYSCTDLITFLPTNLSNGINFSFSWSGCESLTSFSALDLSSGDTFRYAWSGCESLTSFPLVDVSSGRQFDAAWQGCNSLTSFPVLDVSSGINFRDTWQGCSSLTSFPELDVSSGIDFYGAWAICTGLTSFPELDVSSGTNFNFAWEQCSSLTSFPELNVSSGTNFAGAWYNCTGLTSFPLLNTSSGTNFGNAWYNCTSLITFPAGMFDNCPATYFYFAWRNCALSQQSVNNILISLDTAGQSDGIVHINLGTSAAPSAAGITARNNLIAKGWSVFTN